VLFQASCTVGLLLRSIPRVAGLPSTEPRDAKRKSALSMPNVPASGSKVTCRNPPILGVIVPPVNRLNWSGSSTVPFWVPGTALFVAM
jgi:hypothetical protein